MKTKDINIDTTNPENWTDEKWVAAYLNIKPNTLRKQRSVGVNYVPYSKIGGSVRYNKLKVMEYAESKGRKPNDRLRFKPNQKRYYQRPYIFSL